MASKLLLTKRLTTISSYDISQDFLSSYDENEIDFEFDFMDGKEYEILFDGIRIYFGKYKIDNSLVFNAKSDFPFLSVAFEFGGESRYVSSVGSDSSVSMSIKKNNYNVFYMPEIDGVATITGSSRDYFILLFTEDYIRGLFKNNFADLTLEFEESLNQKVPYLMFEESCKIPGKLLEIVNEIRECYYEHTIKEVFVRSKVMEMFAFIFSEYKKDMLSKKIKKTDYVIIRKAEELINSNLDKHIALERMSFELGTNQKKLKELFKLVHDETVFGYSSRVRMERAREFLMKDNTINEVSVLVGYKNPQHFSTAFKKRFGYLPSEYKRRFEFMKL